MTIQVTLVPRELQFETTIEPRSLLNLFGESVNEAARNAIDYNGLSQRVIESPALIRAVTQRVLETFDHSEFQATVVSNLDMTEICDSVDMDVLADSVMGSRTFRRIMAEAIADRVQAERLDIQNRIFLDMQSKIDEMLLTVPGDICQRVMTMLATKLTGEIDV